MADHNTERLKRDIKLVELPSNSLSAAHRLQERGLDKRFKSWRPPKGV